MEGPMGFESGEILKDFAETQQRIFQTCFYSVTDNTHYAIVIRWIAFNHRQAIPTG